MGMYDIEEFIKSEPPMEVEPSLVYCESTLKHLREIKTCVPGEVK